MPEPIRKLTLDSGAVRYRVVLDVGTRPNGKRDQRSRTFPTRKEASAYVSSTRAQLNSGNYVKPAKETLDQHLDRWLESKRLAGKRRATLRCYQDALKPVRAHLGARALQDVRAEDVEQVKARMLDGTAGRIGVAGEPLSSRSVNLMLTALQAALEQAVKRGKVQRNVAALVDRVPSDTKPGAAWSPDEAAGSEQQLTETRCTRHGC